MSSPYSWLAAHRPLCFNPSLLKLFLTASDSLPLGPLIFKDCQHALLHLLCSFCRRPLLREPSSDLPFLFKVLNRYMRIEIQPPPLQVTGVTGFPYRRGSKPGRISPSFFFFGNSDRVRAGRGNRTGLRWWRLRDDTARRAGRFVTGSALRGAPARRSRPRGCAGSPGSTPSRTTSGALPPNGAWPSAGRGPRR